MGIPSVGLRNGLVSFTICPSAAVKVKDFLSVETTMESRDALRFFALTGILGLAACAAPTPVPPPEMVTGEEWRAEPPLGHRADAARRNLQPGDTLRFRDLRVTVASPAGDPAAPAAPAAQADPPPARLILHSGDRREERRVPAGGAIRWNGYRIAVLAVRAPGELGGGLTELEVATVASLPPEVAASDSAGGAAMRLRIPHEITHVTLHHSGSPQPLRPEDDPVAKLRGLQSWGASDRNWWDVPYHFLIDLDGRIYQGRDWRYMGETNTTYDPRGHLLISVLGNYGIQEPTEAQLEAITDLMTWGVATFDVPPSRLGGHYYYAGTSCPGEHLRRYLEDGTFRRAVDARLEAAGLEWRER